MRWLVAFALVACSGPARTAEPMRPAPPPSESPRGPTNAPGDAAPIPTVHAKRDISDAPHGGVIVTLAMSPDGSAVLSADELGGVRLWPALDGSEEPRIVDMPVPRQLAVGRIPGGYSAVALDEAGGLYLAKLDDRGRQISHTTIGAEPAITGIAMTDLGLLAWRSDQTILRLDADGAQLDKLATEPEQRLVALAVNGKRAVAVLERGEGAKRQARWLTVEPKLAWGAWTKVTDKLAGTIDVALSPNGKRLAALVRNERASTALVFDLGSGKALASGGFNSASADIGFADDDRVALGGFEGLIWIDLKAPDPKLSTLVSVAPGSRPQAVLGTGGGHAVSAFNGELTIWTSGAGGAPQYLGYDTVSPRLAEVGPDGQLLVAVADHMLLLDKQLRAGVLASPLTSLTGMVADVRWVGDDNWLLENTSPADPTLQVALLDGHGASTVLRKGLKENQILQYEPSTQLVTLSFGATAEVARFDRKGKQLDHIASVTKASPYEQVMLVPVSPALAHGTQLVQITMKDKSTIKWLRDPAALDKPSATVTVDGPFAGADAAGHVFMWRNTPGGQLELVLYQDGKVVRTLPNTGAMALWPDPQGTRYVEVAQSSVALYDLTGKQLWFQQLATSQEALWMSDGSLAITSAGGIARLDAATGAVTAARCGWRFGLAAKPHPASPRVEPLCAQLRR